MTFSPRSLPVTLDESELDLVPPIRFTFLTQNISLRIDTVTIIADKINTNPNKFSLLSLLCGITFPCNTLYERSFYFNFSQNQGSLLGGRG
jgi:hypothetical protein